MMMMPLCSGPTLFMAIFLLNKKVYIVIRKNFFFLFEENNTMD
jgi:hypothetical protein